MPDLEYLSIVKPIDLPPSALRAGDLIRLDDRSPWERVLDVGPDPDEPRLAAVTTDGHPGRHVICLPNGNTLAVAVSPRDPSLPDRLAEHARTLGWERIGRSPFDPHHARPWFRRGRVAVWQTCDGGAWLSGVQASPGDGYARHARYDSLLKALEDDRDAP